MARDSLFDYVLNVLMGLGLGAGAIKIGKKLFADDEAEDITALRGLDGSVERPHAEQMQVETVEDRVAILRDLVRSGRRDPDVIIATRKALSKKCGDTWCVAEKDHEAEVIAIFDEARSQVRYTMDSVDADTYVSPKWTLRSGGGDCDCEIVVLASMLGAVGYPTRFRVVQTHDAAERGEDWDHIYLVVGLPPNNVEKWVALDPTEPHPAGWEVPDDAVVRRKDFDT